MDKPLKEISEQIKLFKEKNPAYNRILDFYEKILSVQEKEKPSVDIPSPSLNKKSLETQLKEGLPLIEKSKFIIDIPSSIRLFEEICEIAKSANEKMNETLKSIEEAILRNDLVIWDLVERNYDESYIKKIAEDTGIDLSILKFLVHESVKPSIYSNVEKLKNLFDPKNWFRGYCPVCGSLPQISALKDKGRRYLMCAFCGFEWRIERLMCPFCGNRDHNKLHYLYAEGEEAHRVDLCDNCKSYVKTVDTRNLSYDPDLDLDDIITIHLDIIASERGYKRPTPNLWGV